MNIHKNARLTPICRERLVMAVLSGQTPEVADEFGEKIVVNGPSVLLKESAVQMLALAIHELATNARKYGFMANARGRLRVQWEIVERSAAEAILQFSWVESGIAGVREHSRGNGYGSQLIERALPYTLGGEVDYRMTEDGVFCEFRLPVSKVMQ